MNEQADSELLRAYAENRSEEAFAELVRRHVDFVYSAALRMVPDTHLAEDVTQQAFLALAKNAGSLTHHPVLAGWLHRTTQNIAAQTVRTNVRRHAREQEAVAMNQLLASESDASWEQIAPHLDNALNALADADREALLLRYFERKSAREMAQVLGINDEAAQKRVTRATDRLRELLARRGAAVGVSSLIVLLAANAVQAAPVGLAATIVTAVALAGATVTATATAATTIAMTTLQKTIVTATVAVLAGVGIYEAKQVAQSRRELRALHELQAQLNDQLAQLQAENQRLQLGSNAQSNSLARPELSELLSLRNKANANALEIAQLKAALTEPKPKVPDFLIKELENFLEAVAAQQKQIGTNSIAGRVRRLSTMLNLTPEQQESMRGIFLANVEARAELDTARVSGSLSLEGIKSGLDKIEAAEDDVLAGVLTPEQLARYKQVKSDDAIAANKAWLNYEQASMKKQLKLSDEQAGKMFTILGSLQPGFGGPGITEYSNAREQLEMRMRAFEGVLTLEQMKTYHNLKMEDIADHVQIPNIIKALKQ